jgi:hypothetical protein
MCVSWKRCVIRRLGSIFRDCTVFSSIGVVTVSTSRVVMVMLRDQSVSRWIDLVAVHADVGDHPAGCNQLLAQQERGRHTHRLDGGIDAASSGQCLDRVEGLAVAAVD